MTALILYSINIAWHMYMHQAGEYQPPSQASQQDHHLSGSILALEVLYRDWVMATISIQPARKQTPNAGFASTKQRDSMYLWKPKNPENHEKERLSKNVRMQ
ncbi:hypothetical protein VTN49DRAFT_5099 [Thermomyces lanuginosus]|uniref:uncharacterized protein n=1 Tax=Thermomyces lanuginosus TaxID=5541 RepID=UPI0037443E75